MNQGTHEGSTVGEGNQRDWPPTPGEWRDALLALAESTGTLEALRRLIVRLPFASPSNAALLDEIDRVTAAARVVLRITAAVPETRTPCNPGDTR